MSRLLWSAWILGLAALFFATGLSCIRGNSQTFDEAVHVGAGYSYWVTGDFRLNQSHPPLVFELATLPPLLLHHPPFRPRPEAWDNVSTLTEYQLGNEFLYRAPVPADQLLALCRLPPLAIGTLLVLLCGWWAHRLWGPRAGVVALAAAALDPNLVAHAALVNNDVAAALFIFASVYLFWEWLAAPRPVLFFWLSLVMSLGLLAKYSCAVTPVILTAIGAGYVLCLWRAGAGAFPAARGLLVGLTLHFSIAAVTIAATFHLVYLFHGGDGFRLWLGGVGAVFQHFDQGHPAYLLGQVSDSGWWYYFPVVMAVKTPLGLLALLACSLLFWRRGPSDKPADLLSLLVPPAILMAGAMVSGLDIGLRHVLPVYPFFFVLASRVVAGGRSAVRTAPLLAALALGAIALSSLSLTPHQLSYFNELAGGPGQGHRYASDSNLDWGQDLRALADHVRRARLGRIYLCYFGTTPLSYYGLDYRWVPGNDDWGFYSDVEAFSPSSWDPAGPEILAISLFKMHGLVPQEIRGFYDRLFLCKSVGRIGYSIYLFDLRQEPMARKCLIDAYVRAGATEFASRELSRLVAQSPAFPLEPELRRLLPPARR